MSRLRTTLALCAITALGCSSVPRIRIAHTVPPHVPLDPTVKLAVQVVSDGAKPTASGVLDAAVSVTQGQVMNKWVAVPDVRNELQGQLQQKGFKLVPVNAAQAILKATPVNWSFQRASLTTGSGRLDVRFQIYKPGARTPLFTDTYWARSNATNLGEPGAMIHASRNVVAAFIRGMQPTRVWNTVPLDDRDPAVKPGIKLCKEGHFDAAYAAFSDVVRSTPNSAPALYDKAVLSESYGKYDEAEQLLLRATKLDPQAMYYDALARVRRARADAVAMKKK